MSTLPEVNLSGLCLCGCGQKTSIAPETNKPQGRIKGLPVRYRVGHARRLPKTFIPNPSGLCKCGCGEKTEIARHSDKSHGYVRGEHKLYVFGHAPRGRFKNGGLYLRPGHKCGKKPRWVIQARDGSCVYFARAVMEAHIGRELLPQEVVHHINRNSTDDRIENLVLFANHSDHMRYGHPEGVRRRG